MKLSTVVLGLCFIFANEASSQVYVSGKKYEPEAQSAGAPAQEVPPPASPVEVDTSHMDDEEKMLHELELKKQKQMKSMQALQKSTQIMQAAPSQVLQKMMKDGKSVIDLKSLTDPKVVADLQKLLRESKVMQMPVEEMKANILKNAQGRPTEWLFTQFPKLLDIAANFMIDPDALPAMMGILPQKDQLQLFLVISIAFFFGSFVIKKILVPKKAGFFSRFLYNTSISLVLTCGLFFIFYSMFETEVGPAVKVIVSTLNS